MPHTIAAGACLLKWPPQTTCILHVGRWTDACRVRWETNLQKGVCGVAFDRQDIAMNKFSAACLESHCHFFDARTQHSKTGDIGPRMPNCLYARHTLCVLLMAVT